MQKTYKFIECVLFCCRQTPASDDSSLIDNSRTLEEMAKSPDNQPHMQLRHRKAVPSDKGTKVFAVSSLLIVYYNLTLPCKRILFEAVCVHVGVIFITYVKSCDSSVHIVLGYGLDDQGSRF